LYPPESAQFEPYFRLEKVGELPNLLLEQQVHGNLQPLRAGEQRRAFDPVS
jgi:hypothetical protein